MEIEDLVVDGVLKEVDISKPETIVVETPTTKIGDDFAVEW